LVTVEIEAVGLDFGHSDHATTAFLWYSAPDPAYNPSPADNAVDVYRNEKLSWATGRNTLTQDVYLDTINPPLWFRGNQTGSFYDPGMMDENTTYYWRIDEINEVDTTTGDVWTFTTGTGIIDSLGKSLEFDGSDDYVNCGNDSSLQIADNQITLEAWIYATAFKNNFWEGCVITKDQNDAAASDCGYMIRIGSSGQVNFNIGNNGWNEVTTPANTLSENTWHHVAATYNGSMMRIYVDGQLIASRIKVLTIGNAVSQPLVIGDSPQWPGRVFQGKIDEVRVWNVHRTQKQIRRTMGDTLNASYYSGPDSGLVGYWRFDEGSGQTAFDLTPNNNHGALGSTTGSDTNDPVWSGGFIVSTGVKEDLSGALPEKFRLYQNYPNPFNPVTVISYGLRVTSYVELTIYNTLGQKVQTLVSEKQNAGHHELNWDASGFASGVYYYRLEAVNPEPVEGSGFVQTRKMILLR